MTAGGAVGRRVAGVVARLYPRRWRDAHGDELAQLTDDLLDDPDEHAWGIVASTAFGAVRETLRIRYLTAGRVVALSLAVALVVGGLGLGALVGGPPASPSLPASGRSPGPVATVTGVETALRARHVRITLDGVAVPLAAIAGQTVGFEPTTATQYRTVLGPGTRFIPAFRFSPIASVKKAIATVVLIELAGRQAARQDRLVSTSAARSYAETQYAEWRAHPVALPHATAADTFLSTTAVASYRTFLTINQELTAVAGPRDAYSDRSPRLRRWMAGQLRTNAVVIDGVPGLDAANLPAVLPPHL